IEYRRQHGAAADWRESLASGRPAVMYFWYRQSPRLLAVTTLSDVDRPFGGLTPDNPPPTVPGMVTVFLDLQGRLLEFQSVPPRRGTPALADNQPDWDALFRAAGLDRQKFKEVTSAWRPPVSADQRVAWEGAWPERPESAIRVEA